MAKVLSSFPSPHLFPTVFCPLVSLIQGEGRWGRKERELLTWKNTTLLLICSCSANHYLMVIRPQPLCHAISQPLDKSFQTQFYRPLLTRPLQFSRPCWIAVTHANSSMVMTSKGICLRNMPEYTLYCSPKEAQINSLSIVNTRSGNGHQIFWSVTCQCTKDLTSYIKFTSEQKGVASILYRWQYLK